MGTLTTAYCNVIQQQVSGKILLLTQAKNTVLAPLEAGKSKLSDLKNESASSASQISGGLNTMSSALLSAVPNVNANVSEILDMAAQCSAFENVAKSLSPQALVNDFTKLLGNSITDAKDSAFSTLKNSVPEFDATKSLLDVEDVVSTCGVSDILSSLDDYFECLTGMCNVSISTSVDQVNALLSDMYLDVNGVLDKAKLYSESGISAAQQLNINSCMSGVSGLLSSASDRLSSAASDLTDKIKNLF